MFDPARGGIGRSIERLGAGVSIALASLAIGACDGGKKIVHHPSPRPYQAAPTDQLSRTLFNFAQFENTAEEPDPDLHQLHQEGAAIDVSRKLDSEAALVEDDLTAGSILNSAEGDADLASVRSEARKLKEVVDPKIRQTVRQQLVRTEIGQVYDDIKGSDSYGQDQKDLQKLAEFPDRKARQAAITGADAYVAESVLNDLAGADLTDPSSLNPSHARSILSELTDPQITQAAETAINSVVASDILGSISGSGLRREQAVKLAKLDIRDSSLLNQVTEAINAYYAGNELPLDNLTKSLSAAGTPQVIYDKGDSADVYVESQADAGTLADTMRQRAQNTLDEADIQLTHVVARHNQIAPPDSRFVISPLRQPFRSISLGGVQGTKLVPDYYTRVGATDTAGAAANLQQFAEIYAQKGKLQLHFEKTTHILPKAAARIRESFTRVKPLLQAAFAAGDLLTIRFIKSDEFNPYYYSTMHEEDILLPNDGSTSIDQLSSAEVHETVHAWARNIDTIGPNISAKEIIALNGACDQLKANSYDQLQNELSLLQSQVLPDLINAAKPKHKPIFKALLHLVKSGELSAFMANETNYGPETFLNGCSGIGLGDIIDYVGSSKNIHDAFDATSYLRKTPAFKEMAKDWYDIISFGSIFSMINESNFVQTNYEFKDELGHSQDDTAEMIASLTDVAVSYPSGLRQVARKLNQHDHQALFNALTVSFEIIEGRHPELKKYLEGLKHSVFD